MGGRLSKVLCSVLLGEGESRFLNIIDLGFYYGFGVDGLTPSQAFSMLRLVDDGAIAATCHCPQCVHELLLLMWGKETTVVEGTRH